MAVALEIYDALKSVGVDEEKAKSTAEKFEEALNGKLERELKGLATSENLTKMESAAREDMAKMENSIRRDMTKMENSIREDMAKMESSIRGDMAKMESSIRGDMAKMESSIRGDMAKIREDMAMMETRIIKWNVGTIIAVAGLTLAIVKFVG